MSQNSPDAFPVATMRPPSSLFDASSMRAPDDGGLAGLGLVMQLLGVVTAVASGVLGFGMIFELLQSSAFSGQSHPGRTLFWVVLVILTVARSVTHMRAGSALLYRQNERPLDGIRRYITLAAIHTVTLIVFFAAVVKSPICQVAALTVLFAAWPAALAIVIRQPRFARFSEMLPMSEDKGFEGASILMTVLGSVGGLAAAIGLILLMLLPSEMRHELPIIAAIAIVVLMLARSVVHVVAGITGMTTANIDRVADAVNRYGNLGITAALAAAAVQFGLAIMAGHPSGSSMMNILALAVLLLAWPIIIRKFFAERQFLDMLNIDPHTGLPRTDATVKSMSTSRAPDRGLTTLGWFLLVGAVFALAVVFMTLIAGHGSATSRDGMEGFGDIVAMLSSLGTQSVWMSLIVGLAQLTASLALITMHPQFRIATLAYGAIATALALVQALPIVRPLIAGGDHIPSGSSVIMSTGSIVVGFATLAIAIVVPVTALVVVLRPSIREL